MVSLCIQASAGREMIFIGCVHIYLHPFTTLVRIPFIATDIAKVPGKYVYRLSKGWTHQLHGSSAALVAGMITALNYPNPFHWTGLPGG